MILLVGVQWCFSPTLATPWAVARQAPLSMDFPGKNTRVGSHFLLQGIFPTQGWNPHLLHWQVDSLPTELQGSPIFCGHVISFICASVWGYLGCFYLGYCE